MKYDHPVIHDGVFYPAGADVPDDQMVVGDSPADDKYTRDDLSHMTVKALKALAEALGIEVKKTAKADIVDAILDAQ